MLGHTRAAAEIVVAALAKQAAAGPSDDEADATADRPTKDLDLLTRMYSMTPGLGEPEPVRLRLADPAVGKSLSYLDLRNVTGATVLAIVRKGGNIVMPSGSVRLEAGDLLALAGAPEAVQHAKKLLVTLPANGG